METKEIARNLNHFVNEIRLDYKGTIDLSLLSEASERLKELESEKENLIHYNADLNNQLNEAEFHIEKLKKQLSEKPEWISVEERLPEVTDKLHWVYRKCGKITLSTYYSNKNWDYDDVTYWMYFPGFPKPKEPTFKDVFLEKFPKASTNDKGDPKACRALIFGEGRCHHNKCSECWNQPYFEEEEKE